MACVTCSHSAASCGGTDHARGERGTSGCEAPAPPRSPAREPGCRDPPSNPNKPDASAHGELVFRREGCGACHTPPLYTNNKLTPADGFTIPREHFQRWGMFGHNGWCATIEDWFDPWRVQDDYVLTGFKPYDRQTFAVRGHVFGLKLSAEDRADLLAFPRT